MPPNNTENSYTARLHLEMYTIKTCAIIRINLATRKASTAHQNNAKRKLPKLEDQPKLY